MKKSQLFSIFFVIFTATILFSACTPNQKNAPDYADTQSELEQKSGFTSLTGTLRLQANLFLLETTTGPVALKSFDVDLNNYVGKNVTVSGKYSGDELFVSEISSDTP